MGFKVDTSFLRYLTMGALGVHQTMTQLGSHGFRPIELERYCGSNKLWATKIKRLRLPDLLCVETGLRVEVRAKSKLTMKMSDSPGNPDRAWDAGLGDDDLLAFIACSGTDAGWQVADEAAFVGVAELRASVGKSKLGNPKSASEGSERDRKWKTVVSKRAGKVLSVGGDRLGVCWDATADQAEKRYTYQLRGLTPYVEKGDVFAAGTEFLAGAPARLARLKDYRGRSYDPFAGLVSTDPVDRYAAAKSFPYRDDDRGKVISALEKLLGSEPEARVRLEAAGSASSLGSMRGEQIIAALLENDDESAEFRMEAVLILAEHGDNTFSRDTLRQVADDAHFRGTELRQAAVWGLGKAGCRDYASLIPYIHDEEENVALHAIAAFDERAPDDVIAQLVALLVSGDIQIASAASESLRVIGSGPVVRQLIRAYDENPAARNWVIATLGRMQPPLVRDVVRGHSSLAALVEPMLLWGHDSHRLATERVSDSLGFLLKQSLINHRP